MPLDRTQTLELIEAERDALQLVGEKTQDLEKTEEGFVSPLPPIGVHAKTLNQLALVRFLRIRAQAPSPSAAKVAGSGTG